MKTVVAGETGGSSAGSFTITRQLAVFMLGQVDTMMSASPVSRPRTFRDVMVDNVGKSTASRLVLNHWSLT